VKYNRFGDTGLVVSRLAFGAMTFGDYDFNGFKANVDEAAARDMVARAIDAGINVFDTADMYSEGQSETLLGKALGKRRPDVVLSTKVFFRTDEAVLHAGLSRRHILDAVEASLRRLGTDFIDLLLLHNVDANTPLEETARALEDVQRQGKVRYAGHSNYAAWQSEKLSGIQRRLGFAPTAAAQVYYSLLGRDIEAEIVPQAQAAGLGLMIWGPLAGGFLSGKYTRDSEVDQGRRKTFDFPPIDKQKGFEVIDKLQQIGAAHDATPAEVSLAWVLTKPWVHTLLIGASRISQLESNLKTAGIQLTAEETAALDALTAPPVRYPQWIQFGEAGAQRAIAEGFKPGQG
jgi:aryl-alcohol dehydrogenase-like predicted oxidoreductase